MWLLLNRWCLDAMLEANLSPSPPSSSMKPSWCSYLEPSKSSWCSCPDPPSPHATPTPHHLSPRPPVAPHPLSPPPTPHSLSSVK
jgi:hypothetical protein